MALALPPGALTGVRLGLSVSQSPDLARLGLDEIHLRLALGEVTRMILLSGGGLAYGGHLDPGGYTMFLVEEIERSSVTRRPLLVCLAWSEHRRLSVPELQTRRNLKLYGTTVCLDQWGNELTDPAADRPEEEAPENDATVRARSLSAMRRYLKDHIDGRIVLGGKRRDFQGEIPGLMEESLLSLEAGQPLYLAAGFGGVTLDIARALGVDDGSWFPTIPDDESADPRVAAGAGKLAEFARSDSWQGLRNGLSEEENRTLAVSWRPSEIAGLAALGLGRIWQQSKSDNTQGDGSP
jgi:hypothetical protein